MSKKLIFVKVIFHSEMTGLDFWTLSACTLVTIDTSLNLCWLTEALGSPYIFGSRHICADIFLICAHGRGCSHGVTQFWFSDGQLHFRKGNLIIYHLKYIIISCSLLTSSLGSNFIFHPLFLFNVNCHNGISTITASLAGQTIPL